MRHAVGFCLGIVTVGVSVCLCMCNRKRDYSVCGGFL